MTPEEKTRRLDALQRLLTSSIVTHEPGPGFLKPIQIFTDEELKRIKEEIFKLL